MRGLASVLAVSSYLASSAPGFRYIIVHSHELESVNAVAAEVSAPATFRVLAPTSRHATFGGHVYEVSLAALVRTNDAVMLHAEKVADHSGASNYEKLPNSPWAGFHVRSQCASIAAGDVAGEHDLAWLSERGWNPVGHLALEQHFKSTKDYNEEIVVSLITKVKSCSDTLEVNSALSKLRSKIRVRAIERK